MSTSTSSQTKYNRRNFLKNAGSLGTIAAGATFSTSVIADNYPQHKAVDGNCEFSQLSSEFTYLNTGTEGSMPRCVLDELSSKQNQWASNPTASYETDKILGKHQHQNRKSIAQFLATKKNNICLTDNTTMGLSMVLMGINFAPSDKVITTNHEHNAIKSPLTLLQDKIGLTVKTRHFPSSNKLRDMDTKQLIDWLLPDIPELHSAKALCVSHVYPTTGVRLPLAALRKRANELDIQYLVVDGAQAFGMIDISEGLNNINHADFYACPGHKWLNGPPSTGILYIKNAKIRPPEFYPVLSQRMGKYEPSGTKDFPMTEALQVRGCSNAPGFAAMHRAIKFEQELGGASAVEKHIIALSNQVKHLVIAHAPKAIVSPSSDSNLLSGLTVFFPFSWDKPEKLFKDKETADNVVTELLKKNIQIRSIGLADSKQSDKKSYVLRVSTAIFNTQQQIESFKLALKEVLSKL